MSFFDEIGGMIFGKEGKQTTQQLSTLTPEQKALLDKLLGELSKGSATGPGETYGKPMVADLSDIENLSLEALEQRILNQGQNSTSAASAALKDIIAKRGAPVDATDFYSKNIRDPLMQDFREQILPDITRRFSGSAAFGSDRMRAEDVATRNLVTTLERGLSDVQYKSSNDAMARLMQAIGLAPGVEAGGTNELLALMSGAGLPRAVEQMKLAADYDEWVRAQNKGDQRVNQILAALGVKGFENVVTQTAGRKGLLEGVAPVIAKSLLMPTGSSALHV